MVEEVDLWDGTTGLLVKMNSAEKVQRVNQRYGFDIALSDVYVFGEYQRVYGSPHLLIGNGFILRIHSKDDRWLITTVDGKSEVGSNECQRKPWIIDVLLSDMSKSYIVGYILNH